MNALTRTEPAKLMLLEFMADKYSLQPEQFSKTVRATCGLSAATPEQVAAFLIVAKEYNLNPLTKEIYAFPAKGGGVVPIVSIDGWVNLVNSNPNCDGFDFEMEHTPDGKLLSCTCTMHRKDRKHPTAVTEYLSECKRPTDPWKMEHRMLRHKALIQAARYAFGYAGIYDEDEGHTIAESDGGVSAGPRDAGPPRAVSEVKVIEHQPEPETGSHLTGDPVDDIPDEQQVTNKGAAPEPRELVPDPKLGTNTFGGWGEAYISLIETSPDRGTLLRWGDANRTRLKTLEKSPEWTAKVTKATKAIHARLEKPDPITSGPQGLPPDDMGEDAPPKPVRRTTAAPKAKKCPDFTKDYDGWLAWNLAAVAAAETPDAIEALYEDMDGVWPDLMPPDKETLLGARRDAESRMEQ